MRDSGSGIGGRANVFRGRQKLARQGYCGCPIPVVKYFLYSFLGKSTVVALERYGFLPIFASSETNGPKNRGSDGEAWNKASYSKCGLAAGGDEFSGKQRPRPN
jgi:hypothetical protein